MCDKDHPYWRSWVIHNLVWNALLYFYISLKKGYGNIKIHPKALHLLHINSSFPPLWNVSQISPWYLESITPAIMRTFGQRANQHKKPSMTDSILILKCSGIIVFFFKNIVHFHFIWKGETENERKRERGYFSSTGPLPKFLLPLGLTRLKEWLHKSGECSIWTQHLYHHLLPPKSVSTGSWVRCERDRARTQASQYEIQGFKVAS